MAENLNLAEPLFSLRRRRVYYVTGFGSNVDKYPEGSVLVCQGYPARGQNRGRILIALGRNESSEEFVSYLCSSSGKMEISRNVAQALKAYREVFVQHALFLRAATFDGTQAEINRKNERLSEIREELGEAYRERRNLERLLFCIRKGEADVAALKLRALDKLVPKVFKAVHFDLPKIEVNTYPITLSGEGEGEFCFDPFSLVYDVNERTLQVEGGARCSADTTVIHPHVYHGEVCLGDYSPQFETYERVHDFASLFSLVLLALTQYNPRSCYRSLGKWTGIEEADEGEWCEFCESDDHDTDECESYFRCSNCHSVCNMDEYATDGECIECSPYCEYCEEYGHELSDCSGGFRCAECERVFGNDERGGEDENDDPLCKACFAEKQGEVENEA